MKIQIQGKSVSRDGLAKALIEKSVPETVIHAINERIDRVNGALKQFEILECAVEFSVRKGHELLNLMINVGLPQGKKPSQQQIEEQTHRLSQIAGAGLEKHQVSNHDSIFKSTFDLTYLESNRKRS